MVIVLSSQPDAVGVVGRLHQQVQGSVEGGLEDAAGSDAGGELEGLGELLGPSVATLGVVDSVAASVVEGFIGVRDEIT